VAPLFALRGLEFAFNAQRPVLRGTDLDLHSGEVVGLTGSNGSGKTTLLHLMVGLLRPQAGTVEAFGRVRCTEEDFRPVRARAGLLFQDPDDQLFCPTVAEDVAFGPLNLDRTHPEAEAIVDRTLGTLGLTAIKDRVTYHLSGGEKRLVSLAAVLAMEPEVLLLDEPSVSLDDAATGRLIEALRKLQQAMVVISHDRRVLEALATRYVRLEQGTLRTV